MSLTISEASAINDLIERLTGQPSVPAYAARPIASDETLVAAVTLLAEHAYKALMAGFSGARAADAVRQLLADQAATAARNECAAELERDIAAAIVSRLDGDELHIDGFGWAADRAAEDDIDDELIVTHPSGRQAVVCVSVRLVGGAPS